MVPQQRKLHRLIWLILALALPILFIRAIFSIPTPVNQEEIYTNDEAGDEILYQPNKQQ